MISQFECEHGCVNVKLKNKDTWAVMGQKLETPTRLQYT